MGGSGRIAGNIRKTASSRVGSRDSGGGRGGIFSALVSRIRKQQGVAPQPVEEEEFDEFGNPIKDKKKFRLHGLGGSVGQRGF